MAENGLLVFELVRSVSMQPEYERQKKKLAQVLHRTICDMRLRERESTTDGMTERLEYVSYALLKLYGFATPWHTLERIDMFHPRHIRALDLAFQQPPRLRDSNPLGGFRV